MDSSNFLVDYFSQYIKLSEEEVELIKQEDIIREYKKDDMLLREGEIAQ